ncbi:polysaccharide pyruvyl transferase family protein [Microbulbifer sp. YPW16]|uniref:polysaccharide pyruvyl transferase family protein n=1 Tax=Microbulbifer sp. YPW16 TaxID=2904242 RepID=UPI001E52F409|nr:polysaccharide pyruvyl transferase family protein [Microbulbifer sp. YPW16]UHQ54874.1 polysaccharide pyruvyl transferase family protein [Microbulbifer sp. YPW16]
MRAPQTLIVTLHRSLNFGAFLQAYALQEVLKSKGLQVAFLDHYNLPQTIKRYFVLLKPKDLTPKGILFNIRKLAEFRKADKYLDTAKSFSSVNSVFLGSDEIWNIKNSSFYPAPEFFGLNIPKTLKKFSYAPCAGNTTTRDMLSVKEIAASLEKMDRISARDQHTASLVRDIAPGKNVAHVLDPTFLFDFSNNEVEFNIEQPYALLYSYKMPTSRAREIRDYADRMGLILVSPGFNNAWCDKVLSCSPFEFLTLVKNAECVITDTFHGTVFAIKYRKDFVSYCQNKEKVRLLLEEFGLESSSIIDGELSNTKEISTDHKNTGQLLHEKLKTSNSYLNDCINFMKGGDE